MDRERIKQIVKMLKSSAAVELAVREGDTCIRVRVGDKRESPIIAAAATAPATLPGAPQAPSAPKADTLNITSRLVGFFYRGRGPEQPPVVEVGDKVKEGQTVGYIESLRKLTEVVCPAAGEVVEIVGESGQPVQFGDVLIQVRPDEGAKPGKGSK